MLHGERRQLLIVNFSHGHIRQLLTIHFSKCLSKCYMVKDESFSLSTSLKCLCKCYMVKEDRFSSSTSQNARVNVTWWKTKTSHYPLLQNVLCKCYMVKEDRVNFSKCLSKCYMAKEDRFSLSTSQNVCVNVTWHSQSFGRNDNTHTVSHQEHNIEIHRSLFSELIIQYSNTQKQNHQPSSYWYCMNRILWTILYRVRLTRSIVPNFDWPSDMKKKN
jgi:hypothetical protein